MTIGVIATITVQQGKGAEFEEAFLALAEQVRRNEPGNIFYLLHRSKSDPLVYTVMEQYQNESDLAAHGTSSHFAAANKVLAKLVAGTPSMQVLDALNTLHS